MESIIIATIKEWNISNYFKIKDKYKKKYCFHLVSSSEELSTQYLKSINPRYIFFPHWSSLIKKEVYNNYECIVFHMTDLPYGRGGSPLQNLLMNEIYDTKISAIRVEEGLDTGAIYLKKDFNISIGSAEENFIKLSNTIFKDMIPSFLNNNLIPEKQTGEITVFKRRKPKDSNISSLNHLSLNKLYDFIRMLDAEGYPKAYLDFNTIKVEFTEVHLKNKKLVGRFEVIENE